MQRTIGVTLTVLGVAIAVLGTLSPGLVALPPGMTYEVVSSGWVLGSVVSWY